MVTFEKCQTSAAENFYNHTVHVVMIIPSYLQSADIAFKDENLIVLSNYNYIN